MQQVVDVADWQTSSDDMMPYVAGSFCVVKYPAHLTIHSTRWRTLLPWTRRSDHWRLFATRPTVDTTTLAGYRRDRRSLGGRCSPCRFGGGSLGG